MNYFDTTYLVSIELSNMCNYSHMHKKCPVSTRTTKEILPAFVVYDIIDTLSKYNYNQSIGFYQYSESLIDPRLFKFIEYASLKCPDANIVVGTNGWYFTEVLAGELYEAGVTFILISAYSQSELDRFNKIRDNIAPLYKDKSFFIRSRVKGGLNGRMYMNGSKPSRKGGRRCYSPLSYILVTSNGKTGFCCADFNREYSYGDVSVNGFEEVIMANYQYLSYIRDELIEGERTLELCKKCNFSMWLSAYRYGRDIRPEKRLLEQHLLEATEENQ